MEHLSHADNIDILEERENNIKEELMVHNSRQRASEEHTTSKLTTTKWKSYITD